MHDDYQIDISKINGVFEKRFLCAYKGLRLKGKSIILKYISTIFKRWYFTALISDTLITPSNLGLKLSQKYTQNVLSIPTLYATSDKSFNFKFINYSIDSHPVVDDLEIFIKSCSPTVQLLEDGFLEEQHISKIISKLSLCDVFYAEYLFLIAFRLNILEKIPSLYTDVVHVTKEFDALYSLDKKQIFIKIVEATASLSASFINDTIDSSTRFISESDLLELLKTPTRIDDIFSRIFSFLGFNDDNIEELWFDDGDNDITESFLSSTFLLGMILDKYFLSPFGSYLRLINPVYLMPFDFAAELDSFFASIKVASDITPALFSPCFFYHATPLGIEYFNLEQEFDYDMPFPKDVPMDMILNAVVSNAAKKISFPKPPVNDSIVYEIKIRLSSSKETWINLEMPSKMTLHELFQEVCREFILNSGNDYSFYPTIEENRFCELTSPKNKRSAKKTDQTTLEQLNLGLKNKFVLVYCNIENASLSRLKKTESNVLKFELELIKIGERKHNRFYPRVTRYSKYFN